ncbi:membrane protein insertase YidC [bacterium]|nr:membrane protein insertase YidC [bacterium]
MDKKLIFFLVGFSLFYFLYYQFVLQPMEKKLPRKTVTAPAPSTPSKTTTTPAPAPTPTAPAPSVAPATPTTAEPAKVVVVDTPLYRAEFTNQGALFTSFRLKNYLDDHRQSLEMVPQSADGTEHPLKLELNDKELSKLANTSVYSVSNDSISLSGRDKQRMEFTFSDGRNSFLKSFEFRADSYLIDFSVAAQQENQFLPVKVGWAPGIETVRSYSKPSFLNPSRGLVNTGEKVEHLDPKDGYQRIGSTVRWAGVENNYFLAIFIPSNAGSQPADAYMAKVSADKKPQNVNVVLAGVRAEPLKMTLFVGPKDYVILDQLGMDLKNAVDFGFFGPITKALFFGMRECYKFTSNYGWAIVLITIVIKIIFTPFTQMSFASMKKMQQMQPEMKKIQEKYAKMKSDDPRKQSMNVEVMALHKRYGVNPLGGCLPMLLQMPVLFAFYKLLSNAIELRGAPFALWLQDLSRPDPFWVTPILMGATMLLQQKMTPATDPMQKNMMYIMPVMFTYISLNLPSGLVLYWLLSNVLAISHQYYFQQQQQKAIPAVVKAT